MTASKLPHKVIYDTDPGVDDAMALYFAMAHPEIELVGITTTFGNVHVEQATVNALYLNAIAGKRVPVAQGVAVPWVKAGEEPPAYIHGADGLGNLAERRAHDQRADPRSAAQFIVDMARQHPGEITLVAVGPLGNLALALMLEPKLPQLVREVVLMGGAITEPGNVSPVAEANIWNDPHAADRVFTAGWKIAMVGLDVTHKVLVHTSMFRRIAERKPHLATQTLHQAVEFYANFYSRRFPELANDPGCCAHDLLAFIYLIRPELFGTIDAAVRVATEGPSQGQTMANRRAFGDYPQAGWKGVAPTRICMQVDSAACVRLFEDTLLGDWLAA